MYYILIKVCILKRVYSKCILLPCGESSVKLSIVKKTEEVAQLF